MKVIIARGKHGSLDKLAASEFLTLAQTVEEYLAECEKICNEEAEGNYRNMLGVFFLKFWIFQI